MSEASAIIIADSVNEVGNRLITFEAKCWRPVLAEQNTHCVLSRNSASSRAIPIEKMLKRYRAERYDNPIVWPREQKGMQGGSDLLGDDLADAMDLWLDIGDYTYAQIAAYVEAHPDAEHRLHKSLLNRLLENGLWQTQIISATQWDGYFWQRTHKDAEPHIRAMAQAMYDAAQESTPHLLKPGEWHLPYWGKNGGHETDWEDAVALVALQEPDLQDNSGEAFDREVDEYAKQCSVARCARVSYLTQSGTRDLGIRLTPPRWSTSPHRG
jgi:hypothetical protein